MKVHRNFDVAKAQLDRAMILYFEGDYYSAATLAGASEEILGKLLEVKGSECDLKTQIREIRAASETFSDKQYTERDVTQTINEVRNWLKHFTEGQQDLAFDEKDEAADLIYRARANYFKLTGEETDNIRRFMSSRINANNAAVRPKVPNA